MICVGCGRPLPANREWFCRNDCVQAWQEANTVRSDLVAVVVPFPVRTVEV